MGTRYIRYFEATNTHKHNKRGYQYISILWNQIKTTLRLLTCFHLFICSSSSQLRTPWRNCRLEGIPIIQNLRNTATSDSGNISKLKKHPHCIVSKSHFTHPPPNIPWYWPFELQMTSKIQHVNTSLTNPVIYKYIYHEYILYFNIQKLPLVPTLWHWEFPTHTAKVCVAVPSEVPSAKVAAVRWPVTHVTHGWFQREARSSNVGVSKNRVPQNGWFIMEIPIEMDDLGLPPFRKHPCGF